MKKKIILFLLVLFLFTNTTLAFDNITTEGIRAYKSGNILKCKELMEKSIEKNQKDKNNKESFAMANYYLAITHARISDAEEAKKYYNEVISLNTDPNLVLAARKGLQCLDDTDCLNKPLNAPPKSEEEDFFMNEDGTGINMDAIKNISEESEKKLNEYRLKRVKEMTNQTGEADYMEVEKLEDFSPMPSRPREFKKKSDSLISNPTDKDIANAVRVLSKAGLLNVGVNPNTIAYTGINNDLMQLNAMFSQPGQNQYDMLPLMLMYQQQGQNGSNKITPEAMQIMINNMMTPDFSSLDSNK